MDFPHWAVLLASRQGLCDLSRWQHFRFLVVPYCLVQPLPTPSVPAESAFASTYILRLRSCRLMDAFVISSLPPILLEELPTAGPLCSPGITPVHRYYGPIRHPLAFDPFPSVNGYGAYLSPVISPWGEEGFSSCLACPRHHAVATTPPEWVSRQCQPSAAHAAFAPGSQARPPGLHTFEATYASTFGLTFRRCKVCFMLRAAGLRLLLGGIQRFSTVGHPKALVACYVVSWQLLRPDFHRLAVDSLSGHTSEWLARLLLCTVYL